MQSTLSKCTSDAGRSVNGLSAGTFAQNALVSIAPGGAVAADAVLVSAAMGKKPTPNTPAVSAAPRRLMRLKRVLLIHGLLTKLLSGDDVATGLPTAPAETGWSRHRRAS